MMKKTLLTGLILLCAWGVLLSVDQDQLQQLPDLQAGGTSGTDQELSSIERSYRDIGIEQAEELKQYGYELFGAWQPPSVGPVGREYIVGPGDVLRMYIWGDPVEFGDLESTYEIPVEEDGRIFFPPLGRISVWGSSIERVTSIITDQLRRRFSGFEIDIVPAEIRQFPVFVSGFVHNPGVVTVTSLWSVLDVLTQTGGVTKEGTLRNIRITRRDGETETVDLYNLFIFGRGEMPKIQEGDVINVTPVGKVAAAGGEVVRPGIYELTDGETVADVLEFSGGIRLSGARERGTLLRREGEDYAVSEGSVLHEQFLASPIEHGDLLLFAVGAAARANLITVKGHVLFPGVYSLTETPVLSELLEKARIRPDTDLSFGTIERAFPEPGEDAYIVFNPREVLDPENDIDYQLNFRDAVELFRKEVTLPKPPIQVFGDIPGGLAAYREGIALLDVLSNKEVPSPAHYQARVIRDGRTIDQVLLRDLLVRGDLQKNLPLQPGDKVFVVRNEEAVYDEGTVKVLGTVERPGVFEITSGMRLSDALELAGGFGDRAYPQGMVVVRESLREQQQRQFEQSASMLEKQIEQFAQAIAAQSLSDDVKFTLQSQIVQQQSILDLARERSDDVFGRIAMGIGDIQSLDEIRGTVDDIILEDGDFIKIPTIPGYIAVMGDIHSGIAVPYDPDQTVRGYLDDVGSIDTRNQKIMIMKTNGKIIHGERTFFGGTTLARETLDPGDLIFAQREIRIPSGITFRNSFMEIVESVAKLAQAIVLSDQAIDVIF